MVTYWMLASIVLGLLAPYAYGCGATGAGVGAGVAAAGAAGHVGEVGHVGEIGHIGHIGDIAHVGDAFGKCIYDEADVRMADGTSKKVKYLNAGDQVMAYDPDTGIHPSRVLGQLHSDKDTLITIVEIETSSGRKIPVTREHSLFVRQCLSDSDWSPKSGKKLAWATACRVIMRLTGMSWKNPSLMCVYSKPKAFYNRSPKLARSLWTTW